MRPSARTRACVAGLLGAALAIASVAAAGEPQATTDPTAAAAGEPQATTDPTATAAQGASPAESEHPFVVVTFANSPYSPAARAGSTGRRYSTNSYGIAQRAHSNAERVATAYSLREIISWPIKELGVHCVVYEIPDSRPTAEVLAALSKDSRVTLAQPLQEFRTLTNENRQPAAGDSYNDPLYGLQTNLLSLDISAAHARAQGDGVTVALIDTGVDASHPDLKDRISSSRSFVAPSLTTPTAPTAASYYRHGTAMAGLIAAVANNNVGIVGIAPLARIRVFEACWQLKPNSDQAACNTFTLAQAIAAAIEAGAPLINMSIAGPADPLLAALVRSGLKRGIIFVGSATDDPDTFPTNVEGVIGVGMSEHDPGNTTLSAPGAHVLTLLPGGQYDFESGSSVAAAEVTGLVALLLSAGSPRSSGSVVSLLKNSSAQASDQNSKGASIDIEAALTRLDAGRTPSRLARTSR